MTLKEAANALREYCRTAPPGEKPVFVVLFAIKYAQELDALDNNAAVARKARLSDKDSYDTEIGYGRKLAKYVTLKDNAS